MAVSLRASQQGLEIVDLARRKKGWTRLATAWCYSAMISQATLKRFWRQIPVIQSSFVAICKAVGVENWEEIADNYSLQQITSREVALAHSPRSQTASLVEFFAYDEAWVGREQLVAALKDKVQGTCRVLILTGITGIGKTALAERLVVELQSDWLQGDWTKFRQENFENEAQASDFASVAARWLEQWGETLTLEERKDTQQLLNHLVKLLRENRYLLLIDSLENLLEGNEEEGWSDFKDKWWSRFFQSLFSAESCLSRLIITSQDLPRQLETFGLRYRNFWHRQSLSGLTQAEQLALFEKTGLKVATESPERVYLERIGAAYEGHPLALRVIAGEIGITPFNGNVLAYWNKYGHEIEEVEKAVEEANIKGVTVSSDDQWELHRYTRSIRRSVRSRLEKTFARLQKDAYHAYVLLCEASVYRCPVPEEFWLNHLEYWDCDEEQQEMALDALRDRYLVEDIIDNNNQCLVRQHNLIRSVALERLKQLGEDDE